MTPGERRETMAFRTYFFDALTGEELGHEMAGGDWKWTGSHVVTPDGTQVLGTATAVEVGRGKARKMVTADDFPGRRVVVKVWAAGHGISDARLLASATQDAASCTPVARRHWSRWLRPASAWMVQAD